jgi:hypothetical protein
MSAFRCTKCGCMENTATSNYWSQKYPSTENGEPLPEKQQLCSQCDPTIGKWHGIFPRQSAKGRMLASDGFLYGKEDVASESFAFRMKRDGLTVVREITEEGIP